MAALDGLGVCWRGGNPIGARETTSDPPAGPRLEEGPYLSRKGIGVLPRETRL
jgi:hypothetical protein